MQLETGTNTRTLASWCLATFHGHPISPQSPLKHTKSLDYFTSLCMCSGGSVSTKKMLHLSITCTTDLNLCTVCMQVWCLSLVKERKIIEDVQRLATKFILNDYVSDYRTRQLKLHILPLSMLHELNDTCLSNPSTSIQLLHHHRLCLFQWQQHSIWFTS